MRHQSEAMATQNLIAGTLGGLKLPSSNFALLIAHETPLHVPRVTC